ncbi:MAG: transcriptional repressor [Firmicutes bacterium]|nr:transcriptional repressor [Bacillota bacterium]
MKKSPYQTKQMALLSAYLLDTRGRHLTVSEICEYFKSRGVQMGTTTVYRHLEAMVQEGVVAKYTVDGSSSACFEYLGHREDCHQPTCVHCKCETCGKLIHLHCDELTNVGQHLLGHHGFAVNPLRTVFYGVCEDCRQLADR